VAARALTGGRILADAAADMRLLREAIQQVFKKE